MIGKLLFFWRGLSFHCEILSTLDSNIVIEIGNHQALGLQKFGVN